MRGSKILLVDDETVFTRNMSGLLSKRGYRVMAVNNGEDAIGALKQHKFDVVVLDLKMPGMDGIGTLQEITKLGLLTQILILTGHGSIESALESGQEDAFTYLLKPVEHDDLVAAIEKASKKKGEIQEKEFKEKVEELYASGLGARGIRKAMSELREIYGIE